MILLFWVTLWHSNPLWIPNAMRQLTYKLDHLILTWELYLSGLEDEHRHQNILNEIGNVLKL